MLYVLQDRELQSAQIHEIVIVTYTFELLGVQKIHYQFKMRV
jgi:hypothetical protein